MAINKLTVGKFTFVDPDLLSGSLSMEKALNASTLGADSVQFPVVCADNSIRNIAENTEIIWTQDDRPKGVFYVDSIDRTGADRYTINGISSMGRLINMPHAGGIYTGQTVKVVVSDICGAVPVIIKEELQDIKLYGWLPYCKPQDSSARDNLIQVLFAIGAYLGTDLNGVLRVEPLWSGISSTVTADRIYTGGSVEYGSPVTSVSVTEHQYVRGGDETTLFEGASVEGDIVTFDSPMYDLVATGFNILESNANYAKLSAGAGTLTGKAYVHLTREISETIDNTSTENVKTVTDATLVSMVNSVSVTSRLAEYYKHTETITAGIVVDGEKPGYIVSIYHPYDKVMVDACIQSMDYTVSGITKANTKALVGFVPPAIGAGYYDTVSVITVSSTVTIPDGVSDITAVLIGGGQGGWSGCAGESVTYKGDIETFATTGEDEKGNEYTQTLYRPALGSNAADGGAPGSGGTPGGVLQMRLSVEPGTTFQCTVGSGGAGGKYSASGSVAGSYGGKTTLTYQGITYSSASGSAQTTGFLDETSGNVYATEGKSGVKGGAGGYGEYTSFDVSDGTAAWNIRQHNAESVSYGGKTYSGGAGYFILPDSDDLFIDSTTPGYNYLGGYAYGGVGGGAAYGANGADGAKADTAKHSGGASSTQVTLPDGGAGANASPITESALFGCGGVGGNGGGGAGGLGSCVLWQNDFGSTTERRIGFYSKEISGGAGSDGGRGGAGCIILYYHTPKDTVISPTVTSDEKYLLDKYGRYIVV